MEADRHSHPDTDRCADSVGQVFYVWRVCVRGLLQTTVCTSRYQYNGWRMAISGWVLYEPQRFNEV